MKIWTGKLKLNADRKKEGPEVEARIILGASVMFEVLEERLENLGTQEWRTASPDEIYAPSWLRALAETGKEVA